MFSIQRFTDSFHRLRELVVDKLLIAAVLPVNKEEKRITSSIFPVLSHFQAIDYPLYYVDIASEDKTWVTDTLVQEGLGIPASPDRSFLDSEDLSWIVARGTHVSGSNSLWLNFSVDKKPDNVKVMVDSLLKLVSLMFLKLELLHVHVFMLRRKFELIPIKIGFFTNF